MERRFDIHRVMVEDILFIINPNSGTRNKGSIRKNKVEAFIRVKTLNASAMETSHAGHATEIAKRAMADGVRRIVSVGGDGTMNEIAKVLIGSDVSLGLVPMGSGNGLARHLNIPLNIDQAMEVAVSGQVTKIDTGEANGNPFLNVMGIGLDAEIGNRFNDSKGRGFLKYLREGWSTLFYYRSARYELVRKQSVEAVDAYLIAIANSSQYGNNAYIAPDASLQDGKLNFVIIQYPGFFGALILIWQMFAKTLYKSEKVEAFCEESITLLLSQPSFFHVDGEILECKDKIEVVTRPLSLGVVVPA